MDGILDDNQIVAIYERCSNTGRWGPDDQLGTLNYITAQKRREAATLVRTGEVVSIARPISPQISSSHPPEHLMLFEQYRPWAAFDYLGLAPHGLAVTHLDAVTHVYWEDRAYNGRIAAEVCTPAGLTYGSIEAQREGIFTRGVLLDVARARGREWLAATALVTPEDLDAAERLAETAVESGDAIFVHVGLGAREAVEGPEDGSVRAGLGPEGALWLHQHEVAVYSGDCMDKMPYPSPRFPLPLHQIGLSAMGLVMLDCPTMVELVAACRRLARHDFLVTAAPLRLVAGTGSAVNPLCLF